MINKHHYLLIIFIFLSLPAFAQFGIGGTKEIKKLKKTELLVVLGYDEAYNDAMKEAIEKNWTFTKYRFISGLEYKKHCSNPAYSFLMQFTIKDWAFKEEKYDDVGIVLGGDCRVGPYEMVSFANMIVMSDPYYKAECIRAVQFMQNYLELGYANNLSSDNYDETYALYNKNHPELGQKTLILQEEDLLEEYQTVNAVSKLYEQKFEFGGQSKVDQATINQEENLVYTKLIFDVHGYKYRCAIRAKDSKILYVIETQNKEIILMGKRTLRELSDVNNTTKQKKFFLGF